MLDVSVLPAFLLAVTVILVTPGPDMAFMVATGIDQGRRAAVRGALGVTSAMTIWVLVAATGLGVALAQVPAALDAIRLAGAGYLAVLAITTWRRAGAPLAEAATVPNVFRRGFVVNITNPKIALFFVAFLPQFLGTAGGSGENPFAQILMLGLLRRRAWSPIWRSAAPGLPRRGARPPPCAAVPTARPAPSTARSRCCW